MAGLVSIGHVAVDWLPLPAITACKKFATVERDADRWSIDRAYNAGGVSADHHFEVGPLPKAHAIANP